MTIQAVIFDIGGVLLRLTDWSHHEKWERQLGLAQGELGRSLNKCEVGLKAYIGQASDNEVWGYVARLYNLNPAQTIEIQADFHKGEFYDPEVGAFLESLRPKYKTALLSNAWPDARQALSENYDFINKVDLAMFSAEEGMAKPDYRFYELALQRLGVTAEEAIFVDDSPVNVAAATALGMWAVQFVTPAQAIAEITRFLQGVPGKPSVG